MPQLSKYVSVNREITKDIQKQLRLQGHFLSGDTEKSFENNEVVQNGLLILEAYAIGHIQVLEEGVESENIPFDSSVRTGAKESQYIQALKLYAMKRMGVGEKEALGVAFAIAKTHEKEGMPSAGSTRHSQSGERRKAIASTFIQNEDKYFNLIDEVVEEELDRTLFQKSIEII